MIYSIAIFPISVLPRKLQLEIAAHPDIAANMNTVAAPLGMTSPTEIVKIALHRIAKELNPGTSELAQGAAEPLQSNALLHLSGKLAGSARSGRQ